jgi:hypothetical protein
MRGLRRWRAGYLGRIGKKWQYQTGTLWKCRAWAALLAGQGKILPVRASPAGLALGYAETAEDEDGDSRFVVVALEVVRRRTGEEMGSLVRDRLNKHRRRSCAYVEYSWSIEDRMLSHSIHLITPYSRARSLHSNSIVKASCIHSHVILRLSQSQLANLACGRSTDATLDDQPRGEPY